MLSSECLYAYRDLYPEDTMYYLEPGDLLFLGHEDLRLIQPYDETDEEFMVRLKRCTKEKNLFLEEWPEYTTDYANLDIDL